MLEILKRINVAKMCNTTGLNLNRIRNYMGGKIAHLTPQEIREIKKYCNDYLVKREREDLDYENSSKPEHN